MRIVNLEWLDKNEKEAIITVSDDNYFLKCFSHPCNYNIGDYIHDPLECLDIIHIEYSYLERFDIIKNNQGFSYELIGIIENKNTGILKVYNFIIHIDETRIPGDITDGMYVKIKTSRIDIW